MKSMKEIIEEQLALHKSLEAQDIYKLLYQSEFGNRHLDDAHIKMMREEYRKCESAYSEKKSEIISEDGLITRVNFRAYKFLIDDENLLFKLIENSAKKIRGSEEGLLDRWEKFTALNAKHRFVHSEDVKRFEDRVIGKYPFHFLPALGHSEGYKAANKPCYAVINMEALKDGNLGI